MADPLFNLDTITEHATVVIDGQAYALLNLEALPAIGYHRLIRLLPRFEQLWTQEQLSEDEGKELSRVLDAIARIVLVAPPEVHDKLTDPQRKAIEQAFLKLPGTPLGPSMAQRRTLDRAMTTTSSPTGAPSSLDSRTRTAGPH